MKRILYQLFRIFVLLFSTGLMAAQAPGDNTRQVLLPGEIYYPASGYSGQQYLFDEWLRGTILTVDGLLYEGQNLKYNMLLDEVFWLSPVAFHQIMLDKGMVEAFSLGNGIGEILRFKKIRLPDPVSGNPVQRFVQVLHEGEISLYMLKNVRASSRSESVNRGGQVVRQVILRDYTRYYLEMPDGSLTSISARRRSLLNNFPEYKREIRTLLRDEKIIIRRKDDLVRAVKVIDKSMSFNFSGDE